MQILLSLPGRIKYVFCFVLCNFIFLSLRKVYIDDNPHSICGFVVHYLKGTVFNFSV